jgi:hypothetical protein
VPKSRVVVKNKQASKTEIGIEINRSSFIGESLVAKHNKEHKWWYLENQDVDEVTVVGIFDSATDLCESTAFWGRQD